LAPASSDLRSLCSLRMMEYLIRIAALPLLLSPLPRSPYL
jgi:hypothetical protein